jgi:hypothetical protein
MRILGIIILLLFATLTKAQSPGSLQIIYQKATDKYVSADMLDRLMIQLREFEKQPAGSNDTLLMQTYKAIAYSYAANNHYKQAYYVFKRYLEFKEQVLARDKANSLKTVTASVTERRQKDEVEQLDIQNKLSQLQIDIDQLESRRSGFKKYFSFGLVALTVLFAVMLVNAGIKLNNSRVKLKQNRERMKELQRIAVVGKYAGGIRAGLRNSLAQIENSAMELKSLSRQHSSSGNDELAKKIEAVESIIRQVKI